MTSENICCDEGLLEFGFVLLKCFKILHFKNSTTMHLSRSNVLVNLSIFKRNMVRQALDTHTLYL